MKKLLAAVLLVAGALALFGVDIVAEEGVALKYKAKSLTPEEAQALKAGLRSRVKQVERVDLELDSDPLRGKLERKTRETGGDNILATATISYDDGTPAFRTLFSGTSPNYFWGNTFTNPGTGTFTVASLTPFVNAPATVETFFCAGVPHTRGDGTVTVAAVAPGATPVLGVTAGVYTASGFVSVPAGFPGPTGSSFVAGHLIDETDCGGATTTANHFGEYIFFDFTTTGGGTGTGFSNAFIPGVFTSTFLPTRSIFSRATIVGPNVPVELTKFGID